MKLKLKRLETQLKPDIETLGNFFMRDQAGKQIYKCCTLELPDKANVKRISCIPKGIYQVEKRTTESHGHHFHILDVPSRDWILIHSANYASELLGCVAPGLSHDDINKDGLMDVASSKAAMQDLNELLPDKFELTIE